MKTIRLEFESALAASPDRVWAHATSVEGLSAEMRPLLRLSVPKGKGSILDFDTGPGRSMFRTWLWLFGVLPIDRSDLTLVEVEPGCRFLEQSPMLGMKLWRHERVITPVAGGARVTDRLEFAPRLSAPLVRWFVRVFFDHRHAVLRHRFGRLAP